MRKTVNVEQRICDFCGYGSITNNSGYLIVDKCIKCGKDFCPKCGDFGADKQFICNKCKERLENGKSNTC